MNKKPRVWWWVVLAMIVAGSLARGADTERRWDLEFANFFQKGTMPLFINARERDGQWIAAVGSSRHPRRGNDAVTYNKSAYYGDFSGLPIKDGKIHGRITLHMTPDPWVPRDGKSFTVLIDVHAELAGAGKLTGEYKLVSAGNEEETVKFGASGRITGAIKESPPQEHPEPVTFHCNMQDALVGADPRFSERCMILRLGLEKGRIVSAIHGRLSRIYTPYDETAFAPGESTATATRDRFTARVVVPTQTLDAEPCQYIYDIDGCVMDALVAGTYTLTVKQGGKPDVLVRSSFDGAAKPGIVQKEIPGDQLWHTQVVGYQPVAPAEHPRLLFRKSDLPALREKARTPEGRAILKRLRTTLDGADGETMTPHFSTATATHVDKNQQLPIGTYTMSHAAGYGLLYQLTGEKKYAEFGRQCFEKALAGVRNRDSRYSFRKPGGALRAGPSLGWYAVGYDLCYDGWDPATREKLGLAIAEYDEGQERGDMRALVTLEGLTLGTMPTDSNHYGLQIGGASLALLAVRGESFVDPSRIDRLLKIAEHGMIRNIVGGFGDGGFFAEGDGTGSMSSQIAYLTAIQAWKNAANKDFINVARPNVRMLTLKWIYQTVFRGGQPEFWPIRGAYGQNVWSRAGLSGCGYYAIGLGAVTEQDKAAMKWCYNRFLRDSDAQLGGPYDTVSPYPHCAVSAFVNWPVDLPEKQPETVLPHCYRDSTYGFYCWRNRWQDDKDTVITTLVNATRGYYESKADYAFYLNCGGKHDNWGTVVNGPTRYWHASPMGETSSLTISNGTCFGVDFTGASGADVLLVTTGPAEGQEVNLGTVKLTCYFPTAGNPPVVKVDGGAAVVGKQRVSLKDGHLVFGVTGR